MEGLQNIGVSLCVACVAISMLSVLIPQKRTRQIMSFVIGLFFISTIITAFSSQAWEFNGVAPEEIQSPKEYNEADFQNAVAQQSADNVTEAVKTLLENEGIFAEDIQITLKISDEGRISVVRAVIYISETDLNRKEEVKSIVYRNISKEPEIYVTGQEVQ